MIEQDKTAMKVCTDACLFGAWVAANVKNASRVLDIGTGTGLLSLLYIQQNSTARIDAIELESSAAEQAAANFRASPWSDRLTVHHCPMQQYDKAVAYDLIITNPPFFENALLSSQESRNKAMHDASLTLEELIRYIDRYLTEGGRVAVLLPYYRSSYFTGLMNDAGLNLLSGLSVKQSPAHDYFRSMHIYTKMQVYHPDRKDITIRETPQQYSEEFISLMKDYYLYL